MNKSELITEIAEFLKKPKSEAESFVNAFIHVVRETIRKKQEVLLVGFMRIYIAERKERVGQNPQTGARIIIPAANVVKIKAGQTLADAVK